jgi:hypothetical protein
MALYLLVVEGAHDAAFFGHILRLRNYARVNYYNNVPDHFRRLVPEKYPPDAKGYLGKVIRFPEFFKTANGEHSIAVAVAGSDDNLIKTLRTPIELLDVTSFRGIGIALDADWEYTAAQRLTAMRQRLDQLNNEGAGDGLPGFPLTLPGQAGVFVDTPPRVGVHVFPDNNSQGALENVLLSCAAANHTIVYDRANQMVASIHTDCPPDDEGLKTFRTQSGRHKAQAGIIANVLRPGGSLAVSLVGTRWLEGQEALPSVQLAIQFVDALIAP